MDTIPPKFEKAKKHKRASKVFDIKKAKDKLGDKPENYCECCGDPVFAAGTDYKLCIEPEELAPLGIGFSHFFRYTRNLIILVTILSIFVSLPCLVCAGIEYKEN